MKLSSDVFNNFSFSVITITSVADSSRSGCCHVLLLLHFLFFSSLVQNNIQLLLSQREFLFDFAMCANLTFDPWVNGNLFNFWSLYWVESNHSAEQILELFTEIVNWSSSRMSFPESVIFLILQKLVIRIVWNSFFKRWISSIHDEQNNT